MRKMGSTLCKHFKITGNLSFKDLKIDLNLK